nr:hypothetical protein [Fusobacterium gastrosuis]
MSSVLLNIQSLYLTSAILGCYYIDQEKGWTLLNRGSVIGRINFNIEKFLLSIEKGNEFDDLIFQIENLEAETLVIGKVENILKDKVVKSQIYLDKESDEVMDTLKNELNNIQYEITKKKKRIRIHSFE